MSKKIDETSGWLQRFAAWVDGDREPPDRTLLVMERRPHRDFRPTEEEFERRVRTGCGNSSTGIPSRPP